MRFTVGLILSIAASTAACGPTPYTKAAGTFGEAARDTATSLAAVPTTLSKTCWDVANLDYIQSRMVRMKAESDGVPLPEGNAGTIPFSEFRKKARAMGQTSYEGYCGSLEKTGEAFSLSVGVLLAYGKSLEALAKTGGYDGSDLKTIVESVAGIADLVKGNEAASSKAVGAIAEGLAELSKVLLRARVEDNIKAYVAEADPKVGALIKALTAYVDAVSTELKVVEERQRTLLDVLEIRAGMSSPPGKLPACAQPKARASAPAPPGAAEQQLADVCDTLAFLKQRSDGALALSFYTFAVKTADDIDESVRLRKSFGEVLADLQKAHGSLLKASAGPEDVPLVLADIASLLSKLSSLKAALQAKEEE